MKQYLDLLRIVRETGVYKQDRTGTGTYSIFGHQMRFNLADGFPLVTTKKTHLKSIIHELLWFLQGETNIRYLKENGVKIWDEWVLAGTGEYRKLTAEETHEKIKKVLGCTEFHVHYCLPGLGTLGDDEAHRVEKTGGKTEVYINSAVYHGEDRYNGGELPNWFYLGAEIAGVKSADGELIAGELGPVYGSQWRSWPNPQMVKLGENLSIYERCVEANQHDDYFELLGKAYVKPRGPERAEALKNLSETFDRLGVPKERKVAKVINPAIDQIANLINQLKNNPDSRRLLVSAWNPAEVDDMALPPCHCLFQFYTAPLTMNERLRVAGGLESFNLGAGLHTQDDILAILDQRGIPTRKLSCQLYQRSADVFLGVPFNIASYALLVMMVAQVTNMAPGEFIWTGGDTHLYSNHVEQADLQLTRKPHALPKMKINPDVKDIFDFKFEDFELVDYIHDGAISAPIAV